MRCAGSRFWKNAHKMFFGGFFIIINLIVCNGRSGVVHLYGHAWVLVVFALNWVLIVFTLSLLQSFDGLKKFQLIKCQQRLMLMSHQTKRDSIYERCLKLDFTEIKFRFKKKNFFSF